MRPNAHIEIMQLTAAGMSGTGGSSKARLEYPKGLAKELVKRRWAWMARESPPPPLEEEEPEFGEGFTGIEGKG